MKANKILIAMGMGSILLCGSAFAASPSAPQVVKPQTGTINFSGKIVNSACTLQADDADWNVNFGQVSTKDLVDGGYSKPHNFTIKLKDCVDLGKGSAVTVTFSSPAKLTEDLLPITGEASGAGIEITPVSEPTKAIKFGEATSPFALPRGTQKNDKAAGVRDIDLEFTARLKGFTTQTEEQPLKAGTFTAVAHFTLNYQ